MSYSSFAFYYDGLTRNVPYEKLADYLLQVLSRHGHVPGLCLDLACGTGSLTVALAKRGIDTLRFGPLKPVGFTDMRTGKRPYAVVQLRQDNSEGNLFNMVGFQTNLKFGEQKRVFSLIPGLKNAEFVKYGVKHRNTIINSPELLDETYNLKKDNNIFFAGQITGVEGYVESIASGLVAALNAVSKLKETKKTVFSEYTMIGALSKYIAAPSSNFQPMNAIFGLLPRLEEKIKDKKLKYTKLADRAISELKNNITNL